jgi:diguanylate cyclase (GGDEF)-like protein
LATEASRTQLQMMLVQQAGPGVLPLSILPSRSFTTFIRAAEQLCLDETLETVIVYWSSASAAHILPNGPRFRQLMRANCGIWFFSEEKQESAEEWCVLIENISLNLIVYGLESPKSDKYQCSGSMDPQIVRLAFSRLLPSWQSINQQESLRLEDAIERLGMPSIKLPLVHRLKAAWPVVKPPMQQSLILPAFGTLLSEQEGLTLQAVEAKNESPSYLPEPPISLPTEQDNQISALGSAISNIAGEIDNGTSLIGNGAELEQTLDGRISYQNLDDFKVKGRQRQAKEQDEGFAQSGISKKDGSLAAESKPSSPLMAAQSIISEIIGRLRHSSDLNSILQFAIENLTKVTRAERGLIWQIVGDQLVVTNEFATTGQNCFVDNKLGAQESAKLGSQESAAIVLEFLSRFPDESGAGVIAIPDTAQDTNLHKMSPTLSSLIELGEVKARLMVQLRSRGIFSGFLELQQCSVRNWSEADAIMLQSVAEMLSVVVQQSFDQSKIEMDAREMKLINEIATLFRESRGQSSRESLVRSIKLVADHMGFVNSQIYLFNSEDKLLIPQIENEASKAVPLSTKESPFVAVFESGRGKVINVEYSKKGDSFFGHDMALVLPLVSEGERLGVFVLWERKSDKMQFRLQDRELGLTIAGHLSKVIQAEQAISQIRADQARAALINNVSNEIRQSLKEADQIMETLVESLRVYFGLALCVVSLYDMQTQAFAKSKTAIDLRLVKDLAGSAGEATNQFVPNIGEELFVQMIDELKHGKTISLSKKELEEKLAGLNVQLPAYFKAATLIPLVHAGKFKGSLCMVSGTRERAVPKNDMKMVADLADRVAVVVSHAELFAQVEMQAVTDPMTGLYNRRYFEEQLTKELDRYQRFKHPFSLIIVDLDLLKKINDKFGHNSGDLAIKHIANVLRRNVRDVDTVGRFGGEEFVVLLPETDNQHARMVSERICSAIREEPLADIGTITASLGLASFPLDAQDRETLFELADQALFLAKDQGRNRVCSVSEDLLPSKIESGSKPLVVAPSSAYTRSDSSAKTIDLHFVAEKGILGILSQIVQAIDERESQNPEHASQVCAYTTKLAGALHYSKEHIEMVSLAAALNNLGKIDIPEDILRKREGLSQDEMELVKGSPAKAARLLEPGRLLQEAAPIIEAYKEHWDGTGYPKGLKGEEIPIEARVIALADAYVSMTIDRPNAKALSQEEAIKAIQNGAGKEYDPRLVRIFVGLLPRQKILAK